MSNCQAVVRIGGAEIHQCELQAPHPGLAHTSNQAGAAWCSDGEARADIRRRR